QFNSAASGSGFGLGFRVRRLDENTLVGHGGAVYGFATELAALPELKLGVVVVATQDCANGITESMGAAALRAMRAAKSGEQLRAFEHSDRVDAQLGRSLAGKFGREASPIDLAWRAGRLFAFPTEGMRLEFRTRAGGLVADDSMSGLGP